MHVLDLIAEGEPFKHHGRFVAHVVHVTAGLVRDDVLTTWEALRIVLAAVFSR